KVVATLIEWRASKLVRAGESLAELAGRLVTQCAVSEHRALKRGKRLRKALAGDPTDQAARPEEAVEARDLERRVWELQATLSPRHQQALEAVARGESGGGSVAEQLGLSEEAARQLARRAREALAAAIRAKGYTAADFLEVDSAA
ncbi:MAG: RNA polymerase sigma factor, partial [Myxococcales bacterium]